MTMFTIEKGFGKFNAKLIPHSSVFVNLTCHLTQTAMEVEKEKEVEKDLMEE